MGKKHKPMDLEKARQEICVPTFMLKILPSYEKRPRICELVRSEITNISVKGAWRWPPRLELSEHGLAPLAGLHVPALISPTPLPTLPTLPPPPFLYTSLTHTHSPP